MSGTIYLQFRGVLIYKYIMTKTSAPKSEFGGPIGQLGIVLFSHFLVYYLWISLTFFSGKLFFPQSLPELASYLSYAKPTLLAAYIFLGFVIVQGFFAYVLPGIKVQGLPVAANGNRPLTYNCNGISCWYATLLLAVVLHFTGIFKLNLFADNFGSILSVAVIFANLLTIYLYVLRRIKNNIDSPTGNIICDLFMGAALNPRLGKLDLKMFSEIRIPWVLLFLLTVSASVKQYQQLGMLTYPMLFMLTAHGLYVNACMKGEECIPTTWDIFHEKFGWMLIFWNYVGVPFVYCFQSFYILHSNIQLPLYYMLPLLVILLVAYYVWDTANSQKNRFRMQQRGTFIKRKAFPQLPWGTLKSPRYIKTASGSMLLTDGWYRYGRKIHYSADTLMALTWGLSCGFSGILPYFYPIFFMGMIAHRYSRDMQRCSEKYGADWELYCKTVKYKFIPYIY